MQYGRRRDQEARTAAVGAWRDDQPGWVCSRSPEHFTIHIATAALVGVDRPGQVAPTATRVLERQGTP
jgi:hypothetical protein